MKTNIILLTKKEDRKKNQVDHRLDYTNLIYHYPI